MQKEIDIYLKIIQENFKYKFIDEYSKAGSDINFIKLERYKSIRSTVKLEIRIYFNYKTGNVTTLISENPEDEKIIKEKVREYSRNLNINQVLD